MERPYRTFRRIRCGWLAALLVAAPLAAQVHLTHLGTYATGSYDAGAAEVATYHAGAQRIYFTNADANTVVALNAADPAQPAALFTIDMTPYGAGVNSVTALADGIAVAVEAAPKTDPGAVVFFDVDGNFLSQVTVGALPDMVTVTPDGTKVLVANEGEPNDDYTIDPVGSVSIIDITGGTAALTQAQVVTLDFSGYTADMLPGVRLFGPGATVAQDMEPEHIAVSPDSQKAFVVCQENNAVARIDLATLTIEHVAALGMKDHGLPGNGLDASNQDNAINIANWPVKGYYMPDGMRAYAVGGQTYVVYANEGDAREWGDFIEPVRIGHASYPLDPAVFPDAETLKQNNNLGRLNATRHGGDINGDGLYEEIHVFGARSFSIRDADGALVYDSGDDFEQITAMAFPADFNSNNDENDSFDSRSDDKGPEPEAIELAEIDGRHYAFIGLERIGGIMVYDITDPAAPTFVQYVNNRDFSGDAEAGTAGDLDVEDITFVSAADSPDGEAFIITANEISGTVSIFRVGPPPPPAQLAVWTYEPVQGTTAAPLANIGTGTSALVGSMTGATTATGSTTGCAQAGGTTAWQIGTADPGTADQSSGVEFRTSTAGHADITFSYDHRISNSGTRTARIQYTLNGTDWTDMELGPDNYTSGCADRGGLDLGRIDASDPVGNNVSDSWGRRTIDFSAVEGANDNPDFGVRILAAHYGTTGQFRQANNVNNVATAGTWRLDNVSFTGHFTGAPPEPATHLAFVGLPATGATGIPVSGFTVEVRRADESVAQEFTGAVSIDLGSGTGGISGTLTQNIVAGIATFSDISFDEAGEKTLTATAGGLTGTSGTITITVAPAQLAVWTYEPVQGTTAAPLANIGTGTSALVGSMTGATTATGSTTGCAQAGGTTAWQIGTADPGTADQSSGVEFRTSTAGHADITFSYDHRISNSGTRTARIQYTLNGTDWTDMELGPDNYTSGCADRGGLDLGRIDASDPVGNNVSDSWGRRTIDFSAVEGANDNPDFGVRILAAHYGTTGQFRQANNVNNVATAGTWRLDNVSFTGQAMEEPAAFTLQILHASDFESPVSAIEAAPNFAAIVDHLEETHANTLTLSSGDNFLPSPVMFSGEDPTLTDPLKAAYEHYYGGPFANNDLRAGIGRADITIMNILGIRAAALGNHEFDLGTNELRNIIGGVNSGSAIRWFGAQFPYLSSNLDFSGDAGLAGLFTAEREEPAFFQSHPAMTAAEIAATPKLAPSTIIHVNDERIGVVGVTTPLLQAISSPGATTLIGPTTNDMAALAAVVQPVIDDLRDIEGIDKIVLLAHLQQIDMEKALAQLLSGVDVIIAGGSNTLMADDTD
ncbi:MAG: choice-of-anchor I family protein, partial [Flavobacteriales bacterium]|nr:choice-of-anchor I family protein [Flavobacteriales bacterium]